LVKFIGAILASKTCYCWSGTSAGGRHVRLHRAANYFGILGMALFIDKNI